MTIVFPFHKGDSSKCKQLLNWIKQLGSGKNHKALLVADAGLNWIPVFELREIASSCFREVELISNPTSISGWPAGPNSLFRSAALHISKTQTGPWFWCETDCIPTKPGWIEILEAEYDQCGRPYMGAVVLCDKPGLPPKHLNGNAVYPANAFDLIGPFCNGSKAFDIASADAVVPLASDTTRIQHFWGQRDLPPTFSRAKTDKSPINTFTLDNLRSNACVFHRSKDGTLIRLLFNQLFPKEISQTDFVLVLPFCRKDCNIALKNVEWMKFLNPTGYLRDVLLSYDSKTPQNVSENIETVCRSIFRSTTVFKYPAPKLEGWPQGPNYAFQSTANYIHHAIQKPWFWMEADMIPLQKNWMQMIKDEFELSDKPFMGAVIHQIGHMNGSGIYPHDFPIQCPVAMKTTDVAWDFKMKDEMISKCHDASHIMQHFWGIHQGQPHYHIGPAPSFKGGLNMQFVNRNCAVLHRCKDGSLIDQLMLEAKQS